MVGLLSPGHSCQGVAKIPQIGGLHPTERLAFLRLQARPTSKTAELNQSPSIQMTLPCALQEEG